MTVKANTKTKDTPTDTFMHDQRERDAEEVKLGQAAPHVKQCHLLSKEATTRLGAARMSTSTPEAIMSDLKRVVDLCADMKGEAKDALKKLPL